jgi:hypothetical protein
LKTSSRLDDPEGECLEDFPTLASATSTRKVLDRTILSAVVLGLASEAWEAVECILLLTILCFLDREVATIRRSHLEHDTTLWDPDLVVVVDTREAQAWVADRQTRSEDSATETSSRIPFSWNQI